MIEINSTPLNWGDLGVGEVPTGTVTLLLADVEGSTRLWQTQPDDMTSAFALLDATLARLVDPHHGVRPVEQGEGDSFVIAFGRASDAVACALDLQRAPLDPIRLRIAIHTGEVQLRDEANYIGLTINRTARLRELAHGGQTVLSSTTADLVADCLPSGAWLVELGSHPVRDMPRPEHVTQLCHPDIRSEFPPLRTVRSTRVHNLPAQLTSFVGRRTEMDDVACSLAEHRLVTLTGAGGAGKTRLAVEVSAILVDRFPGGIWYVDLAPVTDPGAVAAAVAHALSLPDQPGRSPTDTVLRFFSDRHGLLLLDNCEHLIDGSGDLAMALLANCARLTILATSREPIGVAGEVTWRVPSLSVEDDAVALFADRARRARPDFRVGDDQAVVREICRRLDGMPLAIELAAARARALTPAQILGSLHDRFRLLTGGARTAVRRQQTLRASVDWSHDLLSEPERASFRRFGVFTGGFDLEAAQAVGGSSAAERYQVMDQLGLLVDKSLVVADDVSGSMRYRMLETVRQYALEKLAEAGEADEVRCRHRDYFTEKACDADRQRLVEFADIELANVRAALAWSQATSDPENALRLASALRPFWLARGRFLEGLVCFDASLTDEPERGVSLPVWVRAVADHGLLSLWGVLPVSLPRAHLALTRARDLGDPALVAAVLNTLGTLTVLQPDECRRHLDEAVEMARQADDLQTLCEVRLSQALAGPFGGDPASRTAAEEGCALADQIGDTFLAWNMRAWLGITLYMQGDLEGSARVHRPVAEEGIATGERFMTCLSNIGLAEVHAFQGRPAEARACIDTALETSAAMGGWAEDVIYTVKGYAELAAGDGAAARTMCEKSWDVTVPQRRPFIRSLNHMAEALLACGELAAARAWADETVASVPGWHKMVALYERARVALAQGEPARAERDSHDSLSIALATGGLLHVPNIMECLAQIAVAESEHQMAARLLGAADAMRRRNGSVRYTIYDAAFSVVQLAAREALGVDAFEAAWAQGAALSTEEAVAYARRGHGDRKRPASGWESLTPAERDVVRLVSEGLSNKDIATRLFVSPRTVQTHLTHVYAKLSLISRTQLVQEAGRHA
ncbi:LuxR C-terminal-related transcriptional regulator [Mycolicibacterium cosmeticum]|uniref:LuxR C-terminal-related transcriptional regulator n=1 Tax=Mycolicibacterium cosmeticum TaxID=258533 RepID=UPI003204E3C8